jgi:hypothetical protein
MSDAAAALPDDIAELKAMIRTFRAELHTRDLLIEKLKHQLETRKNWSGFGPPVMIGPSPAS